MRGKRKRGGGGVKRSCIPDALVIYVFYIIQLEVDIKLIDIPKVGLEAAHQYKSCRDGSGPDTSHVDLLLSTSSLTRA